MESINKCQSEGISDIFLAQLSGRWVWDISGSFVDGSETSSSDLNLPVMGGSVDFRSNTLAVVKAAEVRDRMPYRDILGGSYNFGSSVGEQRICSIGSILRLEALKPQEGESAHTLKTVLFQNPDQVIFFHMDGNRLGCNKGIYIRPKVCNSQESSKSDENSPKKIAMLAAAGPYIWSSSCQGAYTCFATSTLHFFEDGRVVVRRHSKGAGEDAVEHEFIDQGQASFVKGRLSICTEKEGPATFGISPDFSEIEVDSNILKCQNEPGLSPAPVGKEKRKKAKKAKAPG